jgi:hypothetical protein
MAKENKISLSLSAQEKQQLQAAVKTIQDILLPQLVQLDPDDRREILKMGDKTVAFVNKAYEHATRNPELAPSYLDLGEMKKDLDAIDDLRAVLMPLEQMNLILTDSIMLAGSEAYNDALVFYNSVKAAAKIKIGASEQIYNDLSVRFPGRPSGKKKE